jgi:GNAT superfamily N-acetyltransferase
MKVKKMNEYEVKARGIRFSVSNDGKEVGHAYLYVLKNDLHEVPFGLLEDVWVDEAERSFGLASGLVRAVISRARVEHCYKLVATSRNDGTRQAIHDWYLRLGFQDYGTEFRMNF